MFHYNDCSRGVYTAPFGLEIEVGGTTSEDEVRMRASRRGGLVHILETWLLRQNF